MTDEKDMLDQLDKYKAEADAEKAKTPKDRMAEAMLKAGASMMQASPKTESKKAGGSVKGWGQARGARKAKIY